MTTLRLTLREVEVLSRALRQYREQLSEMEEDPCYDSEDVESATDEMREVDSIFDLMEGKKAR